jgi:transcriptional regulator with XRE-family HTH domain
MLCCLFSITYEGFTVPNDRVWKRRQQLGYSMVELSKRAGIHQPQMSLIEKSGWVPDDAVQARVAEALETTVEELFPAPAQPAANVS